MNVLPVYQAAAEAAGVDVSGDRVDPDDIRAIQGVLRNLDAALGSAIGDEIVINVKLGRQDT